MLNCAMMCVCACDCVCDYVCVWSTYWVNVAAQTIESASQCITNISRFFYDRVLHVSYIRSSKQSTKQRMCARVTSLSVSWYTHITTFASLSLLPSSLFPHIAICTYYICLAAACNCFVVVVVVALHAVFFVIVIITLRCYCWFCALIFLSI